MSQMITRRRMLAAGAASGGLLFGSQCGQDSSQIKSQESGERGPGREAFWGPAPDRNLVRDLTPGTTSIRIAGFLWHRAGISPGDLVQELRETGHTAANTGPEPWGTMSDSSLRELRDALRQHDVQVFEVGGYRNLLHPDDSVRRENNRHIAYCLEIAEKLDCPMVGTLSGSRYAEGADNSIKFKAHPDNWTMEAWHVLIDSIRQILKDTAGMKAVIGIEAQVNTNQDAPLSHRRLLDDVGDERLKVNLDPVNMIHLYNHFHTTELINECFDLLGEDIVGCHAKDSVVLPNLHTIHIEEACPGRGSMDYETYLVRMSRMNEPRALLAEHIPDDQYPEAKAYIRKVAAEVGVKIYGESV